MSIKAFATGKFALGICDRCGFQYPLSELTKEWTGLMVCKEECFERKHPQLFPIRLTTDPEALRNARPDRSEPLAIYLGSIGLDLQPRKRIYGKGHIGSPTVTIL
jgi:hypothetical protein|tara:strand:+ start:1255 stop:1569 length:315 start_codon:yes stop_codon:yes gene_type:complete